MSSGTKLPPPPPPPPPKVTPAPPTPPTLSGLKALGTPYIPCVGLWYNNQVLNIDGYSFERCRFDNCRLFSNSGNFEIVNCHLGSDTTIVHGENNVKVIKLFNKNSTWVSENLEVFAPIRNDDGTISIK